MRASSLEKTVADALSQVSEVESVCICRDGHSLSVFTIIGDHADTTYDRIYEVERPLIHQLQDSLFDFNVISRRGRYLHEVMGDNIPVWRRQTTSDPSSAQVTI